jgi:hypothetical protein
MAIPARLGTEPIWDFLSLVESYRCLISAMFIKLGIINKDNKNDNKVAPIIFNSIL